MNNQQKLIAAVIAALVVVALVASIAGFYAIPFAIAAAGAALMLFGNHLGIYALPVATVALMKKTIKFALVAVVIVWAWGLVKDAAKEKPATKGAQTGSVTATPEASPEKWDLSQRREEFIQEARELKAGEVVTITFPCYRVKGGIMWYQISTSPRMRVEYDLLDGKAPLKDGPDELLVVKRWPPVIKVHAGNAGGKMGLTLNRQFLPDQPKKEARKVSSKKTRIAKKAVRKDLPAPVADVANDVQIM